MIDAEVVSWLTTMRKSSYVKRLHIEQTIGTQNLGHHCFNVSMLCLAILGGEVSVYLLAGALFHDMHEGEHGDPPSPILAENEVLREQYRSMQSAFDKLHFDQFGFCHRMTLEELKILQWADGLELGYFCVDQMRLGNSNMAVVFSRVCKRLHTYEHIGNTKTIFEHMVKEGMKLCR